jgi:hypothetical protein
VWGMLVSRWASAVMASRFPSRAARPVYHLRRPGGPDVLATARAQRWDPPEVVRVLLAEEVVGRDNATRRKREGRSTTGHPRRA